MIGLILFGGIFAVFAVMGASGTSASPSPSNAELRAALRKLWEDHIVYTNKLIVSALANMPDQQVVLQRLLKNQGDLGDAIKPFYGQEAAAKLAALLHDHIMIAVDVVHAAVGGDPHALQAQQSRWSANADDIAAFLSTANPNWARNDLKSMLQTHLDRTTDEVVARLHGDWAGEIAAYDRNHDHMLMLSDALADGISKQFAARDRGRGNYR